MSRQSKPGKSNAAANRHHPGPAPRELVVRTAAERWVRWLVPVLIAVVTFAAFLPTLHNQFVSWDDEENFLDNYHYRGLGWPQLHWMWTTFHMGHYIPLTWMTLGLDYLLWGMNPVGYHLTSLLLHAANAAVFFFLVRRLLTLALPSPSERGHALAVSAAFAALVFAIHPLRVESVAWATERRDVLSGLFYLLTILVYLRACDRGERGRWYWLAVALFGCALLSKSMAVSLPVVLLILDVYPLRRLGGSIGWWSASSRRVYLEKLPFALQAGVASAFAFLALRNGIAPLDQLGGLGRLAVSAYGLSFYLWKTVAPVSLSPLYELGTVNPWATPFLLSYGGVLAITALVLVFRRRWPGLPAAWLAYVVILLPVLGIFHNGLQIAADRYTYLAGLGWAILAGAGLLSCWRARPLLISGSVVCIVLGLGVLTWNQVRVWHDSQKLWAHALAIDPKSSMAHLSLGLALARQGKRAEAIEHYRQALEIKPDDAKALNNWGAALADQGKLAEAVEHYQQVLKIKPGDAKALNNWGLALAQQGKPAEAIEQYQRALTIRPDYADPHHNWGLALAQQGKLAEAMNHYRQALTIKPDLAEALNNWGVALARQGKPGEAIEHYRQALTIKPDFAEALNNWGLALAQQGKPAEAIERYEQALKIRPDYTDAVNSLGLALNNWGLALSSQGRLAEAIERYKRALKVRPDYADPHHNWGVALAWQGEPAEAIEHYRHALHIRPDYASAHNNWGLALAQQGKPAEAIEHYRQALSIKPDLAEALNNWGLALVRQDKPAEAIERYQRALKIRPDFAQALNNWGVAVARQGKVAEASERYQRALTIKPDFAEAHRNLGLALAQQGKLAEAVEHYQRALHINPDDANASKLLHDLLGQGIGKEDAAPGRKAKKAE